MNGWSTHEGNAVCLPIDNIDTDQLIPARFMSQPRADGYGQFLLHDMRLQANGDPNPVFPLTRHASASVLIAGRNFGTGSSREAAVYALVDAGIHVVVAAGFGDIFAANAVNNGLLPASVSEQDLHKLHSCIGDMTANTVVSIETCMMCIGDTQTRFELDSSSQAKLINGWDDIDLTREHNKLISGFSSKRYKRYVWAWPASTQFDEHR